MITPQQKELVQKTWTMVVPIADKAAELLERWTVIHLDRNGPTLCCAQPS